jgi:L-malate glycosyltransferase
MNVKTVVIVTSYWEKSPGGGILTYVTGLVDALRRKDLEVRIIFKDGVDQENYHIRNRFLFPIRAFWILRKIKPEVIHAQATWYTIFPGYFYKKFYKAKLICTLHSSPGKRRPPLYEKILMQFLLNQCDWVTFVSKALKGEVETIEGYRFNRTAIAYAGVTRRRVSERDVTEFRNRFGLKEDSIVLLAQAFTANALKAQGAKLLIKAVGKLSDKYPNMVLVLTREGAWSDELKGFTKNVGLCDRVIFTGNVENPYIPLAVCDIYTHTSLSEGLPMALLEAMSMAKPIIATFVGGIPEAVSNMENGILVEPFEDEIVKAIELLLVDKNLAGKLGANAKITAEQKFNWDQSANRLLELYKGD